jgi:Tol biopolymer transport system component
VADDTNASDDVFVRDTRTGTTRLASVPADGAKADAGSGYGFSLSATGRYIAFGSDATNMVPGDTNAQRDVFLRDLEKGTTELISVRPDGSAVPPLGGNSDVAGSAGSSVSADGRYVLFSSNSSMLVPNDSNRQNNDWFVRDRRTARTERISVASDGTDRAIASAGDAAITPDGAYVVFRTAANLSATDNGSCGQSGPLAGDTDTDVYVHDMRTGATELVSRGSDGSHAQATLADDPSGCQSSTAGTISDDGRTVAFVSTASNLVPGDTNRLTDVFVRERGPELGVGGFRAGQGSSTPPSSDPLACVADVCIPPLAGEATIVDASLAHRRHSADLFLRLRVQQMPTFALASPALVYGLDVAVGDRQYQVRVAKTGVAATAGLFRLDAAGWTRVAGLRGGQGTTGSEVVVAVPLADLGAPAGFRVSKASAFTGIGTFSTGVTHVLHHVALIPKDEVTP